MPHAIKNEFVVSICPGLNEDGSEIVYCPTRHHHYFAVRYRGRPFKMGSDPDFTEEMARECLPKMVDGELVVRSRGDSTFFAKHELVNKEAPSDAVEVELEADRVALL